MTKEVIFCWQLMYTWRCGAASIPFDSQAELTVYTLNNELENLLTDVVNQAQQAGK
ncbi:hypothetical protein ACNKHS_01800 [Shigella flexneri]